LVQQALAIGSPPPGRLDCERGLWNAGAALRLAKRWLIWAMDSDGDSIANACWTNSHNNGTPMLALSRQINKGLVTSRGCEASLLLHIVRFFN